MSGCCREVLVAWLLYYLATLALPGDAARKPVHRVKVLLREQVDYCCLWLGYCLGYCWERLSIPPTRGRGVRGVDGRGCGPFNLSVLVPACFRPSHRGEWDEGEGWGSLGG